MTTELIIQSSGKFEREPRWAPYFHERSETADEDFGTTMFFLVTPDVVALFPELDGIYGVLLHEDYQGFVHTDTFATETAYGEATGSCGAYAEYDDTMEVYV